jgi:hypothetical protein
MPGPVGMLAIINLARRRPGWAALAKRLLGFGGVLKKANIGGDEAGVAFRSLMSTVQSPTAGAKTAMLANGLNYKNYQKTRDRLDVNPFVEDVAARYGVKLDKNTRSGLGKIFSNKDLISDPAKFNPAVTSLLRGSLEGADAKSLKSIAGAAGRYRDSSVTSVDANAVIKDLLPKLANNLPLANKMFGAKQGGRIESKTVPKAMPARSPANVWPASTARSAGSKAPSRTSKPLSADRSTMTARAGR